MNVNFIKLNRSTITLIGATCVTFLALALSTAAALDRASIPADKILMVALYVIFCLISHLILCLTKRKLSLRLHGLVLMLWLFSMFMTCSNHLTFLIKADIRAGVERAKLSPKIENLNYEIKVVEDAISQVVARPVTIVTNEKTTTFDRKKLYGLNKELGEANRKEFLVDRLNCRSCFLEPL